MGKFKTKLGPGSDDPSGVLQGSSLTQVGLGIRKFWGLKLKSGILAGTSNPIPDYASTQLQAEQAYLLT